MSRTIDINRDGSFDEYGLTDSQISHIKRGIESGLEDNMLVTDVEIDDDEIYFNAVPLDDEDVPYGCRTCGGDYPLCASGCSLMDD